MAEKSEIKKIPKTQIIGKLSDIESPLHGLSQSQIVEIAIRFDISLPFQYIEGMECLDCLITYAKSIAIGNQDFIVVPSEGALRIYLK